jgi:PKHD-type hydroxylase
MWSFQKDTQERWAWSGNVFTPEECDYIINSFKDGLNTATLMGDDPGGRVNTDYRNSRTRFIQPDGNNNWIFERLSNAVVKLNEQFWNYDLHGFAEGLQFTEYTSPGGKYDLHIDKVYNGVIRKLSIVIQLSDPNHYEGGEFHYQDSMSADVLPKHRGMMLAFPSYALHGVTPVTAGTRYSLVAWITGPNLK